MKDFFKEFFSKVDVIQFLVALTLMFSFTIITLALVYREIPQGNREALLYLLGIISGAMLSMATFYWGSSKGSQKKSDTIDKMSEQITDKITK